MQMPNRIQTFLKTGKVAHARKWGVVCFELYIRKMNELNVYKVVRGFDLSNRLIGVPFVLVFEVLSILYQPGLLQDHFQILETSANSGISHSLSQSR
jgi:hypothetical protein